MTLYETKYALSRDGKVQEFNARDMGGGFYTDLDRFGWIRLELGKDCFETIEEAREAVRLMCDKRINSLKRQIEKLEKIKLEKSR